MKNYKNFFKMEVKKIGVSWYFYAAIVLYAIMHLLDFNRDIENNLYLQIANSNMVGTFFPISVIWIVFPHALSYLRERSCNNFDYIVKRSTKKVYINTKLITIALSGAFISVIGFLLYCVMLIVITKSSCGVTDSIEGTITGYLGKVLLEDNIVLYWLFQITMRAMFGAFFAVFGLFLSMIISNTFVTCIVTYIAWYFLLLAGDNWIADLFRMDQILLGCLWLGRTLYSYLYGLLFFGVLLELVCILCKNLFYVQMQEDRKRQLGLRHELGADKIHSARLRSKRRKCKNIYVGIIRHNFRKLRRNPKLLLIVFLILLVTWHQTQGFVKESIDQHIGINVLAILPLLYGNGIPIGRIMIGIGAILLFCDAPFIDDNQIFIVGRVGRKKYCIAQLIYMYFVSFLYVVFILVIQALFLLKRLGIGTEWGTLFQNISMGSGVLGKIYVTPDLLEQYTVCQAFLHQVVLLYLVTVFIGEFIYFVNAAFGKLLGVGSACILVMLGRIPYLVSACNWIYWISPVSLSELMHLDVNKTTEYPPIQYAYLVLIGLNIILFVLTYFTANYEKPVLGISQIVAAVARVSSKLELWFVAHANKKDCT